MRKKVDFVNVWDNLTPRQKEILSFFVEGKSDKEIAKKLFLSPRTVTTHIHYILKKFGAKSRAKLIVFYYRDSGITITKEGLNYGIRQTT